MNHTPGPWQIVPDTDGVSWTVVSKRGQRALANVTGMGVANEANALLIAAAPDMKTKLQKVNQWLDRLIAASENQLATCRFESLCDAIRADIKNYRATKADISLTIAKTEAPNGSVLSSSATR